MTANEFCSLQHCRNYGCSKLNRDKDLCMEVDPPAKPSAVRRGIDCKIQTPRWSVKDCRAKKCDFLGTEELINGGRCCLFGGRHSTMPGTLTRCLQDPEMPPEELLDKIPLPPIPGEKEEDDDTPYCYRPRKSPGIKNCPDLCPYKLIEEVEGSGKRKIKKGTCAFCGETLGGGCGICHTTILDSGDLMNAQIGLIGAAFERRSHPPSSETCGGYCCPDGVYRCEKGETSCPLIKVPFADLPGCPLWRIPAKLLPAQVAQIPEKPGKPADPVPDSGQEEKTPSRKSSQKEKKSPRALTQKEKPAEAAPEKKRKKSAADTPALNVLYLEDCEQLTKRMEPESIDLIFTDPPYVTEPIDDDGVTQWERAYVALHLIASKVLKPSGFLITYAPQAHLQDIMEILAYGSSRKIMVNESGGTLDYFWIIPSLNGGATCKAHKWNALCLHKPILVYQKAPFKSPSKCFADVIRGKKQKSYHAWQQSVHDVLGILSRFMEPGQVVYDPYACTATTLIAGQLLGMQYIGAEIDPKSHAIGVRELQQRPMDLFTFGGEMPEPVVRETIEAPKDKSKQAAIDPQITKPLETGKLLAAIEQSGARPVELHAACLDCEAVDRCMRQDPHANCLQEFLDFEKVMEEAREEKEEKIPSIAWCQHRSCQEFDHTSFICITTGKKIEEMTYCPTQHLVDDERKRKAATSPLIVRWCGNCGHHKARKTFHESCPRLPDLMFKGGKLSADQLMIETACEKKCDHWFPKEDKGKGKPEEKVITCYYSGKDLSPSLGTCPVKCPYRNAGKASCDFMDQQFLRMESCPTGVLQGDTSGQKQQLENMARALARLSADLPSEDRCQCFPCPDGVIRCGIGDKNCPFVNEPFKQMALCPMTNPRRVRQVRRERPVKFVSIKETPEGKTPSDPVDTAPAEKPNCGGKRPAISRCPDNCPDRSIEKEGGYPQGRCRQTGEKLREMQICPNDPPKAEKKPARKPKARKEPETANPFYKFLNEHVDQIAEGKDVPIVPPRLVEEEYKKQEDAARRPLKLFMFMHYCSGDKFWTLSQSGKIKPVKKPAGDLHCGQSTPQCVFNFQWRHASRMKGDDN
jgi:hypothetical protein